MHAPLERLDFSVNMLESKGGRDEIGTGLIAGIPRKYPAPLKPSRIQTVTLLRERPTTPLVNDHRTRDS